MNTLKAYLELIRYPLFAIPIAATLPGALIASEGEWNWRVGLTLLIAARLLRRHDEERLLPPRAGCPCEPGPSTPIASTYASAGTDYRKQHLHHLRHLGIHASH